MDKKKVTRAKGRVARVVDAEEEYQQKVWQDTMIDEVGD
jgi:hypothetical protein